MTNTRTERVSQDLTPAQRKRVADAYKAGVMLADLADRFGSQAAGKSLKDILDEFNVPLRSAKRRRRRG